MPLQNKTLYIFTNIWIGFILAISFMEAWIKFLADGVTLTIGLAVGQLVFFALNKVEIVLATILLLWYFKNKPASKRIFHLLIAAISILAFQSICILPVLDQRVEMLLAGKTVEKSCYHIIYVLAEVTKLGCLIGINILPLTTKKP